MLFIKPYFISKLLVGHFPQIVDQLCCNLVNNLPPKWMILLPIPCNWILQHVKHIPTKLFLVIYHKVIPLFHFSNLKFLQSHGDNENKPPMQEWWQSFCMIAYIDNAFYIAQHCALKCKAWWELYGTSSVVCTISLLLGSSFNGSIGINCLLLKGNLQDLVNMLIDPNKALEGSRKTL